MADASARNGGIWEDAKAFRRRVVLPAAQAAALGEDGLALAIAYEAEPFSGIPATSAEVAWRETESADKSLRVFEAAIRPMRGAGSGGRGAASVAKPVLLALAVAALLAACDAFFLLRERRSLEAELPARRAMQGEIDALRSQARAVSTAAAEVRTRREREAAAGRRAAHLRAAWPRCLAAVATACGGRTVVKSFSSPRPWTLEAAAAAPSAAAAAAAMKRLGESAAAAGWTLSAGNVETAPGGTSAVFGFRLELANPEEGE